MQNKIKNIFKYTMPITITFYSSVVLGNELEIQKFLNEYDKSNAIIMNEISISASKVPIELSKTGSSVQVITEEEIKNSNEMFLVDFLNSTSGISIDQTGPSGSTSNIRMRGSSPHYVKILIDGIDITKTSAPQSTPYLEKFMLKDLERIEVLKGNQSSLYGSQAIAGVVSMTTKKPTKDGFANKISLEYGSNSTANLSYTIDNRTEKNDLSLRVQKYDTEGFSAADENLGNAEKDGYENTSIYLKNTYYFNENFSLNFGGFKINDNGDFDAFGPIDSSTHYFKEKSEGFNIGGNLISNFNHSFNYSYYNSDRDNYGPNSWDNYKGKGERNSYAYKTSKAISSKYNFVGGFDFIKDKAIISSNKKSSDTIGLFIENIYEVNENLTTAFGLRQDRHSKFGDKSVYRTSLAYNYNGVIYKGSYGTGYRAPSLYELFASTDGNINLKPESSQNFDIGFSTKLDVVPVKLSTTFFKNEIKDRIDYTWGTGYHQTTTKEERKGYEFDVNYTATKLTNAKISYSNVTDEKGDHVRKIPKNRLSVTVNSKLSKQIDSSFKLTSVSDLIDIVTLPDYNVFDVKFSYMINNYKLLLKIDNVFDEQYQVVNKYGTSNRAFYIGLDGAF